MTENVVYYEATVTMLKWGSLSCLIRITALQEKTPVTLLNVKIGFNSFLIIYGKVNYILKLVGELYWQS